MGNFVVRVSAVGGHGCQRDLKDGEVVPGCGQPNCPDCAARRFVEELKAMGCSFDTGSADQPGGATLTHWPGQPTSVVDDLLSGVRKGNF